MREKFEAWARDLGINVARNMHDDGYAFPVARASWRAWQASRAVSLEEAAQVCEQAARERNVVEMSVGASLCMDAIRALAAEGVQ